MKKVAFTLSVFSIFNKSSVELLFGPSSKVRATYFLFSSNAGNVSFILSCETRSVSMNGAISLYFRVTLEVPVEFFGKTIVNSSGV